MELSREQISRIEIGKTYKNFKQICNILEISCPSGKKQYGLYRLEFRRFFNYERIGNRIKILSEYSTPLAKIPVGNNPYGELIDILILKMLLEDDAEGYIFLSTSRLLLSLSMINNNYNYFRYDINKLNKLTEIDNLNIIEWYSLTHSNLKRSLHTVLDRLQDQALIKHENAITICKLINGREKHMEASILDKRRILKAENEVLEELNTDKISKVIGSGKYFKFIKMVNETLLTKYSIKYYYNSYKITTHPNKNILEDKENELIKRAIESNRLETKKELNSRIVNKMGKNIHKRSTDGINLEYEDIDTEQFENKIFLSLITKEQKRLIRSGEEYIDSGIELNTLLLDMKTKRIRD